MLNTGVVWVTWGQHEPPVLWRSLESVKKLGLATCLICEHEPTSPRRSGFDHVVRFKPPVSDARCRTAALRELAPFDITLTLDTDCVVLKDVEFGFAMARRHGLALSIAAASHAVSCHGMAEQYPFDLIQYNAGVIFFDRIRAADLLQRWSDYALHRKLSHLPKKDQPALAAAMYDEAINPFVLPPTWNLRPVFGQDAGFGPVTIWHAPRPVPTGLEKQRGFWRLSPWNGRDRQLVIAG